MKEITICINKLDGTALYVYPGEKYDGDNCVSKFICTHHEVKSEMYITPYLFQRGRVEKPDKKLPIFKVVDNVINFIRDVVDNTIAHYIKQYNE